MACPGGRLALHEKMWMRLAQGKPNLNIALLELQAGKQFLRFLPDANCGMELRPRTLRHSCSDADMALPASQTNNLRPKLIGRYLCVFVRLSGDALRPT